MKALKSLKNIRELFWPLLEKAKESEISTVSQEDVNLKSEDDIKIAFELAQKIYNDEQDRNKTIETKSVVFVGSIGFVIAIIIGITNFLLSGQNVYFNAITAGIVLVTIVLIAYLVRSSWYSIKALTRQKFQVLRFDDIIKHDKNYLKQIIAKIINLRVDYMTMAQEYYKRAIVTLFIYCLFVFFVLIGKLQTGSNDLAISLGKIASLLRNGDLFSVLTILILIINTTLLIIILRRLRQ